MIKRRGMSSTWPHIIVVLAIGMAPAASGCVADADNSAEQPAAAAAAAERFDFGPTYAEVLLDGADIYAVLKSSVTDQELARLHYLSADDVWQISDGDAMVPLGGTLSDPTPENVASTLATFWQRKQPDAEAGYWCGECDNWGHKGYWAPKTICHDGYCYQTYWCVNCYGCYGC
jgi:hypothetical protein